MIDKKIEFYEQKLKETKAEYFARQKRKIPKILNQEIDKRWASYHGDSCEVTKAIPNDSIHYQVFSPPFASLFTYSDSERDMGNSKNMEEFIEHFKHLIPELYRIHMPGRLISVHCMNLPATLGHDGYIGVKDFRGYIINLFRQAGFYFHSSCSSRG